MSDVEMKLPRGPWAARWEAGQLAGFVDADGRWIFGAGGYLDADPEVIRAIEALPLLVEMAQELEKLDRIGVVHLWPDKRRALRKALALVDGGGKGA